jgi:hypothetical protein
MPITFEQARGRAYGLLGDAADWMRGLPAANNVQARAVLRFYRAIDAAKAALNDAANAARPSTRRTHGEH